MADSMYKENFVTICLKNINKQKYHKKTIKIYDSSARDIKGNLKMLKLKRQN